MTPEQVEALITLAGGAAAAALALAQTIKALLEAADLLAKRRRRTRRRVIPRGHGGRPRRSRKNPLARRSAAPARGTGTAAPRRGRGQGPRPGPGRGRAPPGHRRPHRDSPVKRHEPPIFQAGSEKPRSNGAFPEKGFSASENCTRLLLVS